MLKIRKIRITFDSKSLRTEHSGHCSGYLNMVLLVVLRSFLQGILIGTALLTHLCALFPCI